MPRVYVHLKNAPVAIQTKRRERERTGLSSSHYPGNKHGDSGTDDPADLFSKERPPLECLVNHCQCLLRKYLRKEMDLSN